MNRLEALNAALAAGGGEDDEIRAALAAAERRLAGDQLAAEREEACLAKRSPEANAARSVLAAEMSEAARN